MEYTKPEVVTVNALSAIQNTGLEKGIGGVFDADQRFNTPLAYQADE